MRHSFPSVGSQLGDFLHSQTNWNLSITTSYVAGYPLPRVRESVKKYICHFEGKLPAFFGILLYIQIATLVQGLHIANASRVGEFPGEKEVLSKAGISGNVIISLMIKFHRLVRAFLFRQLDEMALHIDISDEIHRKQHPLKSLHVIGIFYEGLASFHLAHKTDDRTKWTAFVKRGESVLARMTLWSQHSTWNWENKRLLLEAESMQLSDNVEETSIVSTYMQAIQSAQRHKFIHEEGIAR